MAVPRVGVCRVVRAASLAAGDSCCRVVCSRFSCSRPVAAHGRNAETQDMYVLRREPLLAFSVRLDHEYPRSPSDWRYQGTPGRYRGYRNSSLLVA